MAKRDVKKLSSEQIPEQISEHYQASWLRLLVAIGIIFIIVIVVALILNFLEKFLVREAEAAELDYQASRLEQSWPGIINLEAGKGFTFEVKFKNTGQRVWLPGRVTFGTSSGEIGTLYHPWWKTQSQPTGLESFVLADKEILFRFAIRAPETNGLFWEKYILARDGQPIPGGEIEIAVRSYGGREPVLIQKEEKKEKPPLEEPVVKEKFWLNGVSQSQTVVPELLKYEEPDLRVGLYYYIEEASKKDSLPIRIVGLGGQAYQVKDKDGALLVFQTEGEETQIDFDYNIQRYFVNLDGQRLLMTDSYLRFTPLNEKGILKIPSFNNNIFWGQTVEDNEYRGELEVQYNSSTGRLWVINELALEDYLKGVYEVEDSSPMEFLKAQVIAARTYAMARHLNPKYTKTPDESSIFDLRATQADQVYRGYAAEKRLARTNQAVRATVGMMVTYQDTPIIAYYFGRSDGRTRDCYQARMCASPVPWLIGVADPPCVEMTMKGHGVGMSQVGARWAAEHGATFQEILTYYYTGTAIKKLY